MVIQKKEIFASAIGRRKEAIAQIQLIRGTGEFQINTKPANLYLNNNTSSLLALKAPFQALQSLEINLQENEIDVFVKVQGGGLIGQTEAIKLGIARAICQLQGFTGDETTLVKKSLKDKGYLTIDARVKERRKYGLKKARKASQYHKR